MKKIFKFSMVVLFFAGSGVAMADDMEHHDDRDHDHVHAKVIIVQKPIHHHHYHPKPHADVILKVGGDDHH